MNKLSFQTSEVNAVNMINALGYSLKDVESYWQGVNQDKVPVRWFFRVTQPGRYCEFQFTHETAGDENVLNIFILQFENPVDDYLSRGQVNDVPVCLTKFTYLEEFKFEGDIYQSFLNGIAEISNQAQ